MVKGTWKLIESPCAYAQVIIPATPGCTMLGIENGDFQIVTNNYLLLPRIFFFF